MDFINTRNEDVELFLSSIILLFCVLIAHDIVESLFVHSKNNLEENSIRNWALLRSHTTLSATIHILRGMPLIGSRYQQNARNEEGSDKASKAKNGKVMYRRYFTMLLVRIVLIAIEIAFIALSLTTSRLVPISDGSVVIAWKGFGAGKVFPIEPRIGCRPAPGSISARDGRTNVLTGLVYCIGLKTNDPYLKSKPKSENLDFELVADFIDDRVALVYKSTKFYDLQFWAYWVTTKPENLRVPLVHGNITEIGELCTKPLCRSEWKAGFYDSLRATYGRNLKLYGEHGLPSSVGAQAQIMGQEQWPLLNDMEYWTKERKLNESLKILSSALELVVIESGSTILYKEEGLLKSRQEEKGILRIRPIVSISKQMLILIFLWAVRVGLEFTRPNVSHAAMYSALKKEIGLDFRNAPLIGRVEQIEQIEGGLDSAD